MEIRICVPEEKYRSDINSLLKQLSKNAGPMIDMRRPNSVFVGVFEGERLVGMGSIYFIVTMWRVISIIEDVIIDVAFQRRGYGEALMRKLNEIACAHGVVHIDLTSKPERTDAHKLYERLGYKKRNTLVFRYECLKKSSAP